MPKRAKRPHGKLDFRGLGEALYSYKRFVIHTVS
jgi:hypothetical protein